MPAPSQVALSPEERSRYARHLVLQGFGSEAQLALRAARVLIVGAGGLGSPAALYLAAAGVGHIGVVDSDTVELSNLQRQVLFDSADIGRQKACAARDRLLRLNPLLEVNAHAVRLQAGNATALLAAYDVVVDGSDRLATRYLINDACVLARKTLVTAAIHRFEGQALSYRPGAGPCYRCLFAEPAVDVPNCAEAGVLGVLPGVMGSIQATEAIKLLTGIGAPLLGRLLVYDALAMSFQEFRVDRRTDCAVCGANPTITSLAEHPTMSSVTLQRIGPTELRSRLHAEQQPPLVLVDVREPHEYAAGHLPDSLHIPLADLPRRFAEIPPDRLPVFICAAGARSLAACQYAQRQSRSAINLEGGLHAWDAEFGGLR